MISQNDQKLQNELASSLSQLYFLFHESKKYSGDFLGAVKKLERFIFLWIISAYLFIHFFKIIFHIF
ncbi:hypothetical protein ACM40_19505 [Chryseobacterium sp. BLS98]|nr:hypothetical protein ACM40_19505 [Chryseobacterium sp. BLS98]